VDARKRRDRQFGPGGRLGAEQGKEAFFQATICFRRETVGTADEFLQPPQFVPRERRYRFRVQEMRDHEAYCFSSFCTRFFHSVRSRLAFDFPPGKYIAAGNEEERMNNTIRRLVAGAVVLLVSAVALGARVEGTGEFEIPAWFKQSFLDLRDDVTEARKSGKRLFVYFHQDGCPYCAELVNNNFSQKDIVDYTRKHFDAIEINMWGDREVTDIDGKTWSEKTFAAHNKVWFTPTLLFFDEDGKVVLRVNGYYPPHQFLAALKYVAGKHDRTVSFRDYFARHAPAKAAGKLHSEPFFAKPPYDLSKQGRTKPLIVFFEQKDCPSCDRLHEKVMTQPDTRDMIARFDAVQLDMWSNAPMVTVDGNRTTARDWARKLGITYAPSAVLFHEGKEVIRMEGFLKAFHVQSVMDYVASGGYKKEPSLQRFIQARADHLLEQGKKVDLWN
jgi:thioredoxin-related protein